ncbi:hypothetical protein AB0K18_43180 [Nonomuraea sp. NPDC049421]|uniref:hypothetical protein n=1 Tax=Nonomuraea sp. NPDC049421 TaxID=3155275 RepID=UPI0034138F6A
MADDEGEGWLQHPPFGDRDEYYDTYPRRDLGELSYEQLAEQRGPLREVGLPTDEDVARLEEALTTAGRKAATTVAVALLNVAMAAAERNREKYGHGQSNLLTAGRPGSWEASTLNSVTWSLGPNIKATRVHPEALQTIEEVLRGWVLDRPVVVEVAENLAAVISRVADDHGGWEAIADRWLVAHEGAETVRNWMCSRAFRTLTEYDAVFLAERNPESLRQQVAEEQKWWLEDEGRRTKSNPAGFANFSRIMSTHVPLTPEKASADEGT